MKNLRTLFVLLLLSATSGIVLASENKKDAQQEKKEVVDWKKLNQEITDAKKAEADALKKYNDVVKTDTELKQALEDLDKAPKDKKPEHEARVNTVKEKLFKPVADAKAKRKETEAAYKKTYATEKPTLNKIYNGLATAGNCVNGKKIAKYFVTDKAERNKAIIFGLMKKKNAIRTAFVATEVFAVAGIFYGVYNYFFADNTQADEDYDDEDNN